MWWKISFSDSYYGNNKKEQIKKEKNKEKNKQKRILKRRKIMKKFTTKLLMSIIAVAFAFVALGTSTYAWFTLNTQVSATNLQVTAKSNATYLLIGDNENIGSTKKNSDNSDLITNVAAVYQNGDQSNAAKYNADKKVYPAALATAAVATAAATENAETTIVEGDWYTASNGHANNATDDIKNYHEVTEGDKDYMLTYKVWMTLSADSEKATKRVKLTYALAQGGDAAVSAYVIINGEKFELNSTATEATTTNTIAFTNSTAIEVTIYMFINGNSTNVYSDYINQPQTITGQASLSFDLVD